MNTVNKEELLKLISYLINHNKYHNEELVELSCSLKECDSIAYKEVLEAIDCFSNGNVHLENALKELMK